MEAGIIFALVTMSEYAPIHLYSTLFKRNNRISNIA